MEFRWIIRGGAGAQLIVPCWGSGSFNLARLVAARDTSRFRKFSQICFPTIMLITIIVVYKDKSDVDF